MEEQNMAHGQHCNISEEFLELYVLERLEAERTVEFEDHLILCSTCQVRVEEMAEHVLALRRALQEIGAEHSVPHNRGSLTHEDCHVGA